MSSKQKTIESLINVLKTGNDANRCFSAQALGRIGDISAVDSLLTALHDEDEDVVMDAAAALGQIGAAAAVRDLIECYQQHPVGDVKVAAVEAIGSIAVNADVDQETVIDFMQEVVSGHGEDLQWQIDDDEWDDWWDAQFKAVEALGNMGALKAVPVLMSALHDEDSQELNEVVFCALAKMGKAGEVVLIECLQTGDTSQRRSAAKHLACLYSEPVTLALGKALKDSDLTVCVAAAKALTSQPESATQSQLMSVFLDSRTSLKRRVLEVMIQSGFQVPQVQLQMLLKDEDELVRLQTLRTISGQSNTELIDQVYGALSDQSLEVVEAAVQTLGTLGVGKAGGTIATLLSEQGLNTNLRVSSAVALGKIGGELELPILLEMLKDPEQPVRLNSLNAIAHLDYPGTEGVLLSALRGELIPEPESVSVEQQESTPSDLENNENQETVVDEQEAESEIEEIPEPKSTLESILQPPTGDGVSDPENETEELNEEQSHFLDIADANRKLNQELQDRKILAPHQDIKRFAAAVLGEMQGEAIVADLIAALSDEEPLVQLTAAESLGRIGDSAAAESLAALLTTAGKEVRLKAAYALGKMRVSLSVVALNEQFQQEDDLFVRIQILQSLTELAEVSVTVEQQNKLERMALQLLNDPESGIRTAAAELLLAVPERKQETALIPEIAKMAFCAGGDQRLEVGRMLRKSSPDAGSELFLELLADQDKENQHRVAIEVLQEIHRV
ncbi:MAG: HEAT repeat domain-containing protein [SAR324 cluster bacterium]|nr:HEAT repeat domain-containing protein [SAR324 cluster bacterium]